MRSKTVVTAHLVRYQPEGKSAMSGVMPGTLVLVRRSSGGRGALPMRRITPSNVTSAVSGWIPKELADDVSGYRGR